MSIPFTAKPGRRFAYSQPGDWVALSSISPGAKSLYLVLCGHVQFDASAESAQCWPSLATLGEILRKANGKPTTAETISAWTRELEMLEAIEIVESRDNRGRHRVYTVHQAPPTGYSGPMSYQQWYQERRNKTAGKPQHEKNGGPDLEKNGVAQHEKNGGPDLEKSGGKEHQGNNTKGITHTPPEPSAQDAAPSGTTEKVCVDAQVVEAVVARVLTQSVPETPRGRLGDKDKARLGAAVSACLQRGHASSTIERRTRGLCNENTLAPMTHLMQALRALESEFPAASAATATTVVSRAAQGHSERSICRRDDCRDGQLVCSLDCTDTCDQLHDPKGANCPTCTGAAPKPRQGGRRIDVKALTEAQRAG